MKRISGYDVGEDPIVFWRPWIGRHLNLAPRDMEDMLITTYVESYEWVTGGG